MRTLRALVAGVCFAVGGAQVPAAEPDEYLASLAQADVSVVTESGAHRFKVWVADDDLSRQRGLMYVRKLPPGHGMLFLFDRPQFASFWM